MSRPLIETPEEEYDEYADYITEDDKPVDNLFIEKQQRLLTQPLYDNWQPDGRTFLVCANVGIFSPLFGRRGIVPDVLLSMDVQIPAGTIRKTYRSYFVKRFGKVPDIVIEIVSLTPSGEEKAKKKKYALLGIPYYVIFDPLHQLNKKEVLTFYQLANGEYIPYIGAFFASIGLGLRMWQGTYANQPEHWLRWFDQDNQMILTGAERAELEQAAKLVAQQRANQEEKRADLAQHRADLAQQRADQEQLAKLAEQQRANQEKGRADLEKERADQERARAELFATKLRELGLDPSKF